MLNDNQSLYVAFVKKTAKASGAVGGVVVGGALTAAIAAPTTAIGFAGGVVASPVTGFMGWVFAACAHNAPPGAGLGGFIMGLFAAPVMGAAAGAKAANAGEVYKVTSAGGRGFFKALGGGVAGIAGSPLLIVDGFAALSRKINEIFAQSDRRAENNNNNYRNNNNNNNYSYQRSPVSLSRQQRDEEAEYYYNRVNNQNNDNNNRNNNYNNNNFNNSSSSSSSNNLVATAPPALKEKQQNLADSKRVLSKFEDQCIDTKNRSNSERLSQILYGDKYKNANAAENLPDEDSAIGKEIRLALIKILTQEWLLYLKENPLPAGENAEQYALKQATDNIDDLLSKIIDAHSCIVREKPIKAQKQDYDLFFLEKYSREVRNLDVGKYELIVNRAQVEATEIMPDYMAQAAERRLEIACLNYISIKNELSPEARLAQFKDFVSTNKGNNHDRLMAATGLSSAEVIEKLVIVSEIKMQSPKEEFYRNRFMAFIPELQGLTSVPAIPCRDSKSNLVDAATYKGTEVLTPDYALQNALETMVGFFQSIRPELNPQLILAEKAEVETKARAANNNKK